MKRIPTAFILTCLVLLSCTGPDISPDPCDRSFAIAASFGSGTRTSVDDSFAVSWCPGDSVHVYHSPAGAGEYIDDGCFVYDEGDGKFKGTLAQRLDAGSRYDWRMQYPFAGSHSDFVQRSSSHSHLAGPQMPLEGTLESCEASKCPVVPMHQTMSALKLTVRNNEMEALVPSKIVFECDGAKAVTLSIEEKMPVAWDSPGTYFIPVHPFTAVAGSSATVKVFTSRNQCFEKTLRFSEERVFNPGVITEAECFLKPGSIPEEELFNNATWNKVMNILEKFQECSQRDRGKVLSIADNILSRMNADGSWPDIDYSSIHPSNWSPITHAGNIRDLARAYHITGSASYLDACRLALNYWDKRKPFSTNWWYNEIDAPMIMAPAFLLLKKGLDDADLKRADRVLAKAYLGLTGQNKLWMSGIVLQRGLLNEDYGMVMDAYESIVSEIRLTTEEGIQPDYSFHQHGKIMQTGLYGLVFAQDMAKWYFIFSGTPLAIQGEKKAILFNYLTLGQDWLVWNGYYDPNVFGRQIQADKDRANTETLQKAHDYSGTTLSRPKGGRYYPYSDLGVYRTAGWYASVRMQSNHLVGIENTLSENMKGYFASDGALLIRRTGLEYLDIWPCWEWKHIPGATTYDDGKPLWGCSGSQPYNKTDKVFGQVCGDVMVVAMDYVRDGLTARKAWFFFEDGILCLGAGITMSKGFPVVTTVEQNIFGGKPTSGDNWVRHRTITYVNLGEGAFEMWTGKRNGKWSDLCPSYENSSVTKEVFELVLRHGVNPRGASYAYGITPGGKTSDEAQRIFSEDVKIVSNTAALQSATIRGTTYTIDWDSCNILH